MSDEEVHQADDRATMTRRQWWSVSRRWIRRVIPASDRISLAVGLGRAWERALTLSPELQQKLCALIRAGVSRGTAAQYYGLSSTQLGEALERDPGFAAEVKAAAAEALAAAEIALRQQQPRAWLRRQQAVAAAAPRRSRKPGCKPGLGRLSVRERRFVREYAEHGNGTRAALRAGYAASSADVQAHRMLRNPRIVAHLHEMQERILNGCEISAERLLSECRALGFFDPAELFDQAGALLPLAEMPPATRHAISSIKSKEWRDSAGRLIGIERRIRFFPKMVALTVLSRYLGIKQREPQEPPRLSLTRVRNQLKEWDARAKLRKAEAEDEVPLL